MSNTEYSHKCYSANKVGYISLGVNVPNVCYDLHDSLVPAPLRGSAGQERQSLVSRALPCSACDLLCSFLLLHALQGVHECEGAEGGSAAQQYSLPQCLLCQLSKGRPCRCCHLAVGQRSHQSPG